VNIILAMPVFSSLLNCDHQQQASPSVMLLTDSQLSWDDTTSSCSSSNNQPVVMVMICVIQRCY